MLTFPIELSLTLITGKCVQVILTDAYVVPATFDRDQPQEDFEGYTDIEYVHTNKLNTLECVDLERRLKRYVERLYDLNHGKKWDYEESFVYND